MYALLGTLAVMDVTTPGGYVNRADLQAVNGSQSADVPGPVSVPYPARHARDPGPALEAVDAEMMPPAGQPGHGTDTSLRRRPARLVEGRVEGGHAEVFEVICCDCGDRRDLDYSRVPPRLQQIRGPYTMEAGLAAFERHLGMPGPPPGDRLSGTP